MSVQGGTFLNDAVLRAFELLTGREVVRPDAAGLMGCFGAALSAHRDYDGVPGTIMSLAELSRFSLSTQTSTCKLCQNHCKLTITTFNDGSRHVSGNRCDRGATQERRATKSDLPYIFTEKFMICGNTSSIIIIIHARKVIMRRLWLSSSPAATSHLRTWTMWS